MQKIEPLRTRALRYLNELNEKDPQQFCSYQAVRGTLNKLLSQQKSLDKRSQDSFQLSSLSKRKQFKRKQMSQKSIDLSQIVNLENLSPIDQRKAHEYRDAREKEALLELMYSKRSFNGMEQQNNFKWRMNSIDKGKNLAYLFNESKLRKHHRKVQKIEVQPPDYNPNYQTIFPRQGSIIIKNEPIKKQTSSSEFKQKLKKQLSFSSIGKKEKTLERMYSNLQSQIQREVNESMFSQPQSKHPLEGFSIKPFSQEHMNMFRDVLKQKLKETYNVKRNIENKLSDVEKLLSQ